MGEPPQQPASKPLATIPYTGSRKNTKASRKSIMRLYRFVIPVLAVGIAGCESLALTAFGVGASAGVTYTMNGIVYRTFTAPLQKLTDASLSALKQMDIDVDSTTESASSVDDPGSYARSRR
jgi:hypothetical protein